MYEHDDEKVFPTRTEATGHANERVMLDRVGGHKGIRTEIRTDADGNETRLRTRGGSPEFVTTKKEPLPEGPLPKLRLVGERMFDRSLTGPYGAFHLDIDFTTSSVTQTEIPLAEYTGTDSTHEYKKYRRNLRWQSADKKRRVWVYVQRGGSYFHGKRIHTGSAELVWFEDDLASPPTRKFISVNPMYLGTAIAIYDIHHSGVDYVVLATDFGYIDTATGNSMTSVGYNYPPSTKPEVQRNEYAEICMYTFRIRSEGRKIAMLPGVLKLGTDRLELPGSHVYNDATDTTESHVSQLSAENTAAYSVVMQDTGYGVNNPTTTTGSGVGSAVYEAILGAYFSGETLVKIRVVSTQAASGTDDRYSAPLPLPGTSSQDTRIYTHRDFTIYHGDEVIYQSACDMNKVSLTNGTTEYRDGAAMTYPYTLFSPEEWVFALIIIEEDPREAFSPPLPGGYRLIPTLRIFDFKRKRRYVKKLPEFMCLYGYGAEFPLLEYGSTGASCVQLNCTYTGLNTTHYATEWLDYTDTSYGSIYYPLANVIGEYSTSPPNGPYARMPMYRYGGVATPYSDSNLYDTGYDFYDKIPVIGSIYADEDCIVVSVQTPLIRYALVEPLPTDPYGSLVIDTNRNDYTNIAIHRSTGTQFEFDNGFGFQSIYKAMETLP